MKKKIESYQGAAGGWGAVKSVANAVRKQMDIRQDVIAMFDMNKPEGFDCPGCAWPDPKHSASFDICENGAKAIAWEVTDKQVNASFFAENTVQSLLTWGDHELEAAGRLTQPLKYDAVSDCYKPLSWQQAFDEIGARLQSYSDPNQVEFYTSGRTSNEAAFLYQLFAREYGSNNFPDCSNMCHEPTSVGLAASIGVGKGTVLLEDFEKCDLVICIGHNPGTNHPRMLTSLRALVKRGAKMIAINPLQERGLERFTAPQNPFEMLTNSETQLASAYYNVRIGGDMALLKGMMRLLIERDDAASAAGRPSLLDDEFIQTHTVGFDELRRDVLNSEWKDIERISGLSQTQIAELADAYAAAERTIICYGMGITQHEHGTQNVQQLVNLLLMKGNIGKPGAGICPLRGHSNVQGDRTVGITEKPSAEFLARLGERYGFTPPQAPGHTAIASMQAICTGQARALILSLVCSVIFIHHAFNANILDKDYAFSDGEILMVDNAVRTHFEPYERHFKEIGFNENTIKKYLQCTNIQTVTVPVPAKFLRASNVPTGLLNEMIAYLNSEERNHHNFSELLLFSCLSIFAACKGFITLLTNGVLSVSGKVRNIVNMKLAHPWKLKDICDCLYISESLLKKKLKQEQTTFSQILLDARMQHAKNLIRVEGSVNKIAEQCGYASTSYFIYTFRKHFGNSPKRVSKEYRCQSHTGMNTGNTMSALAI